MTAAVSLPEVDRVEILSALQALAPKLIVPSHCTGWKAVHEIARVMPDAFVPNSVGTTFLIGMN